MSPEITSVVSADAKRREQHGDLKRLLDRVRDAAHSAESAADELDGAADDLREALNEGVEGAPSKPDDDLLEVAVQRLHQQAHREPNDAYHWRSCLKPGCHALATNELSPRTVA